MKLASYEKDGTRGVGIVVDESIHPVAGVSSMLELIDRHPDGKVGDVLKADAPAVPLADVRLTAPVSPAVRDYFCVGLNYLKHVEEGQASRGSVPDEVPKYVTFFTKASLAEAGPFDPVPLHAKTTRRLDYEAEMAAVIGRRGVDIPENEALDYVFGYCCANDISARELQRRHGGQWVKGKSLDGTCPTGPWIVTADAIPDPQTLDIECRLNGEVMQQSNTANMMFPVARIIAELSQGMTLLPGDVILTGTPEGVGFARKPPVYLAEGDVVETTVAQIGTLSNRIGERA